MNKDTFYTLLDISAHATSAEIDAAYQRQCDRYSAARVAALGDEFRAIAEIRNAELERAYAVLSDAERRRAYDAGIGLTAAEPAPSVPESPPQAQRKSGLSRRELLMAGSGALAGLLVIALVWVLAGRSAGAALPPAAQTNRPAPDFALTGIDGRTVRLSDYRGKVVLLNFWYTGCEPCREETPALEAAYKKLAPQGFEIIGMNVRANERRGADGDADIRTFIEAHGVSYPIALDSDSQSGRDYQVYVLPTSLMIDREGKIRYLLFSATTTEAVEALFTKLQQETSAGR
jgi:cytochrome c biogenesis protein CcmG, thiol:disulfide interchange protein DsbE